MNTKKTIVGALGAILILVISQMLAGGIASGLIMLKISDWIGNIVAGILYIGFTYLFLKVFAEKILKLNLESLGIPRFHMNLRWIIVAFILPLVVTGIYLLLPGEFVNTNMDKIQIASTIGGGILFTGIAAGFVEEMVFRGFILNLLKNRWNRTVAIFVPSVLFGVVHILGMNFSIFSCLLVLIAGTLVGIMFSLIEQENNSIWNSGIVHVVWNIVIIGGILSISGTPDKYSIITYVLKSKSFAVTGGEFGIESSVISVVAYILVSIYAAYRIKRKADIK